MKDGYSYEFHGKRWRASSDERWETVVYSPKGSETLVGQRYIDDTLVNVYLCPDGKYRAQLKLGAT